MKYHVISRLEDPVAAVVERLPDGGPADWRYHCGKPLVADFPKGAKLKFSKNYPDRRALRDFIPNLQSVLIVSAKVRAILAAYANVPTEYLPVTICSHTGAVVAKDYTILNLLGGVPIVDMKKSKFQIGHLDKTQITSFDKLVVDYAAIGKDDVFFRASMRRRLIVMRQDVKEAFEKQVISGWQSFPCDGWDGLTV